MQQVLFCYFVTTCRYELIVIISLEMLQYICFKFVGLIQWIAMDKVQNMCELLLKIMADLVILFKLCRINNINHMNNSYLFFKKPKPNKSNKQVVTNSNKSIISNKLNHSISGSSNHSNYNKSQSKVKKQSNITLTKRQKEIRQAIQYRFQKSKLKNFTYKKYHKKQFNLNQNQRSSSHSSQMEQFKTMKKITTLNLYEYHENKTKYMKQQAKLRQQSKNRSNLQKNKQNTSPATNIANRFKSNIKSEHSNNSSLNKNLRSVKDIYMNSILNLANKNTVKNKHYQNYLSLKKNDLSLKEKFNKIQKMDKTTKHASDWKSILIKLKDSKSSIKDSKNMYSHREQVKSPKSNKFLIDHSAINTTQYNKNIKSFKNLNFSQERKKGDLQKLQKNNKNIELDIDKQYQFNQFSDYHQSGQERIRRNLNDLKKEHSKQIKKILQRSYKKSDLKYK